MMVLFLMRAHDMSFEETLMGESLVTNLTHNVLYCLKTDDVRLRDVHFERTFLRKYFAALLAHGSYIVSHEIVFVQLQFESEGALTNAAFERSITSVVSRDVMIQQGFIVEESIAILASQLSRVTDATFVSDVVLLHLMTNQSASRTKLKTAHFAKGGRFRVLLQLALLQMRF